MSGALALLLAASVWTGLIAIPLLAVLLRVEGLAVLVDPEVLAIARATALQAGVSTALSALVGLPLGLWAGALAARGGGRKARWLQGLFSLPYGVPTVVAASAWIIWLGRSGLLARLGLPLDWAYSFQAVVLAHVFFNAPWLAGLVMRARGFVSEPQLEAAWTLGAGRWRSFRTVVWPAVKWTLAAGVAQVFSLCVMSFALVLLLGGGPPVQTLETALYSHLRFGMLDLGGAVSCAVWELGLSLVPWTIVLWARAREEKSREGASSSVAKATYGSPRRRPFQWTAALFLGGFFVVPYLAVFLAEPWKELARPELWPELRSALLISLDLAALSSLASVAVALCFLRAGRAVKTVRPLGLVLDVLFGLPSGISVLVIGLGVWLAYGSWIDPFSGSLVAMVLVQTGVFYPLAYRMLWPLAAERAGSTVEAALLLGASRWRAFWIVEWPRWRASVFGALALVAGASLGEVAAVSLFYSEDLIPLPLVLSRWMGQYRFQQAESVAALLLVLSSVTIMVVQWFGRKNAVGLVEGPRYTRA